MIGMDREIRGRRGIGSEREMDIPGKGFSIVGSGGGECVMVGGE